jgi:hypothetical protein
MLLVDFGLSINNTNNILTLFLEFLLNKIGSVFFVIFGILFNNLFLAYMIKGY